MDELERRFVEATRRMLSRPLAAGLTLRQVSRERWLEQSREPLAEWIPEEGRVDWSAVFGLDQRAAHAALDARLGSTPLAHHLVLEDADGTAVGFFDGHQDTRARYYMEYSAVAPGLRRRGIYRAYLDRLLELATECGFREVYSRHLASNNAVLVPKLARGFRIAAFEVSTAYGLLVELRYFLAEGQRELHDRRVAGRSGLNTDG